MAQLSSPGISVTVVDESFYTPGAPGTVPLIVVATAANKMNSAGTGVATGTLAANAGKVYLLTSQADLGSTFGIPYFQTDAENNPVHAGEVNEYGLQAAYSLLGVASRAYVVRANVDLGQLEGSGTAPAGLPENNTYWWNTSTTSFGVFQWNSAAATTAGGQTFSVKSVSVITNPVYLSNPSDPTTAPASSYGALGDYAITATTTLNQLWLKRYNTTSDGGPSTAGTWVKVGSSDWAASWPTAVGGSGAYDETHSTIKINGTTVTNLGTTQSTMAVAINANGTLTAAGITAAAINGILNLYSTGDSITIEAGDTNNGLANSGLTAREYFAPALTISQHYNIPTYGVYEDNNPTGSVWIKTTPVNQGANWDIEKYNTDTESWIRQSVTALYPNNQKAMAALDPKGGGINIPVGQVYVKYNDDEEQNPVQADFKIYQRTSTGALSITSSAITSSTFTVGTNEFTIAESTINGSLTSPVTISFTAAGALADANALLAALQAELADTVVSATLNSDNSITISHTQGGDIRFVDETNYPLSAIFSVGTTANFYPSSNGAEDNYLATAWSSVNAAGSALVTPGATAPATTPADGTLWYDSVTSDVDIMINDGTHWRGYLTTSGKAVVNPGVGGDYTDPAGPIVSASKPNTQSDGSALAHGDLWLDSSNLENWPTIYKYNYLTKKWVLVDSTDQTTQNGVVFGDARWAVQPGSGTQTGAGKASSIASLLSTDFVDLDVPDPALYPKGILLYNLRRSSFNVKKYVKNHVDTNAYNTSYQNTLQTAYYPDAWVSAAANDYRGTGQFGRKSQRAVVVQSLNALIQSNQNMRDEDSLIFNLLSCPGYLETLPALRALNTDRGLLSFIVADAPARLTSDATSLNNWGKNVNVATTDGEDGLVSTDSNSAVYYPWGYTTDLTGNNVVVPPSHMMLRTIALSDQVAYPWFAPAGTRRGGITNASSVGYVDGQSGEFIPVSLNNGQRDTLAGVHVNPITYIGGIGLVAYGQFTRQLVASSLDRINVARLVIYLRYQLNAIAKPYIFEPNDTITRNEIRNQINALLLNLTSQRALYDYLVVCDTSNNTPSRIDANELHVDIAIEPVKAVEFIYIPLRLENTGAIKGLSSK